jgi:hypothetical protein
VAGVDQQVHEHLVELGGDAVHLGQGRVVVLDHGAFVLELVPDDVEGGVEAGVEVGPAEAGFADPGEVLEVLDDVLDAGQAVLGFGQQLEDVFVEEVEVLALLDRGEGRGLPAAWIRRPWCRRPG